MVYGGVLTAVTLGVIPLFIASLLTSPAIKAQLRKAAGKMLQLKLCWGNLLAVYKQSRLKMLRIQCWRWQRRWYIHE